MAVSECGLLCKYVLIIFNILFGLLGIAMFGLGLWLRFSSSTGGLFNIDFNTRQFVIGVTVLISIGAVMVIISAFGDYGACSENKTALRVFYFTVGLLAIVVILAGILAYFYSNKVGDEMSTFYMTVYRKYFTKKDLGLSVTLKIFHNALHCCGIGGFFELFAQDTCPSVKSITDVLSMTPCPAVIKMLFETRAPVVLGLLIGTGVLMFITMACSRVLMKQIRKYETARIYFN